MEKRVLFLILSFFFCTQNFFSQSNTKIDDLVNKDSFKFYAEKVIASGRKQDMKVTNSLSSISRSINLNQEFYLLIQDKKLSVNLPDYQNQIDQSQGGLLHNFEFNSTDFKILKKRLKRGGWIIRINPLDIARARNGVISEIVINTNSLGKTIATIYLNTNGPNNTRVFEGYITNNES